MTVVVILGIPRSGTSMLAEACHHLGVHMNAAKRADWRNERGYWEDDDFTRLNEMMMHEAGGRWEDPPTVDAVNGLDYRIPVLQLLKLRDEQHKLWGWKDPRTCLTLRHYLPHLKDARFVIIWRRETGTVQSLKRGYGMDEARDVTRRYREALAQSTAGLFRLQLQYEWVLGQPGSAVAAIARHIGVEPTYAAINCIERRLNHEEGDGHTETSS